MSPKVEFWALMLNSPLRKATCGGLAGIWSGRNGIATGCGVAATGAATRWTFALGWSAWHGAARRPAIIATSKNRICTRAPAIRNARNGQACGDPSNKIVALRLERKTEKRGAKTAVGSGPSGLLPGRIIALAGSNLRVLLERGDLDRAVAPVSLKVSRMIGDGILAAQLILDSGK